MRYFLLLLMLTLGVQAGDPLFAAKVKKYMLDHGVNPRTVDFTGPVLLIDNGEDVSIANWGLSELVQPTQEQLDATVDLELVDEPFDHLDIVDGHAVLKPVEAQAEADTAVKQEAGDYTKWDDDPRTRAAIEAMVQLFHIDPAVVKSAIADNLTRQEAEQLQPDTTPVGE